MAQPTISGKNVFEISANVIFTRTSPNEIAIIDVYGDPDELYTLSHWAAEMWLLFDGKNDLNLIVKNLSKRSKISETKVLKEAHNIIKPLIKRKFLVAVKP